MISRSYGKEVPSRYAEAALDAVLSLFLPIRGTHSLMLLVIGAQKSGNALRCLTGSVSL